MTVPGTRLDERDLAITSRGGAEVARRAVLQGGLAVAISVLVMGGAGLAGSITGLLAVAVSSTGLGWVAYSHPFRSVRKEAARRRAEFDLSVAVLLDLVNIQMAGGAGLETALISAASLGDGWAFGAMRSALGAAQSSRRSYWDALIELADRYGISSLSETAHAARLAGEHGSRVRQSLVSKAASLRARNLSATEFEAQQQTEQMGLPMVLLFLSFLLFVGYPAMSQTMGSF